MLKKLLPALLLGMATVASAQTNFQPGYVVTPAGDTLRGEVDARGAQRNARLARFRPSASQPITDYEPQQLRGYGFVGDRVYQVDTVPLSTCTAPPAYSGAMPDTTRHLVFLEVIVGGAASLLYLRDERSNDHYYLSTTGHKTQELLPPPVRRVADDDATYQTAANAFRRTIAAATQQCLMIQPDIAGVRYNQSSLSKIVERYNRCLGETSTTPAAAAYKSHVRIGVIGGVETSQLVLSGRRLGSDFVIKGRSDQPSPVLGLALSVGLTRINKTISARIEGFYESQRYLLRSQIGTSNLYDEYRATLTSIRVPLLLRYTYPRGVIRPFAQAGLGFSYLLENDNEQRQFVRDPSTVAWAQITAPRSLEQGLIGSVGMATAWANRRNTSAELRYERSNGFSNAVGFGSRVDRLYLLLSYDLTK